MRPAGSSPMVTSKYTWRVVRLRVTQRSGVVSGRQDRQIWSATHLVCHLVQLLLALIRGGQGHQRQERDGAGSQAGGAARHGVVEGTHLSLPG